MKDNKLIDVVFEVAAVVAIVVVCGAAAAVLFKCYVDCLILMGVM